MQTKPHFGGVFFGVFTVYLKSPPAPANDRFPPGFGGSKPREDKPREEAVAEKPREEAVAEKPRDDRFPPTRSSSRMSDREPPPEPRDDRMPPPRK